MHYNYFLDSSCSLPDVFWKKQCKKACVFFANENQVYLLRDDFIHDCPKMCDIMFALIFSWNTSVCLFISSNNGVVIDFNYSYQKESFFF